MGLNEVISGGVTTAFDALADLVQHVTVDPVATRDLSTLELVPGGPSITHRCIPVETTRTDKVGPGFKPVLTLVIEGFIPDGARLTLMGRVLKYSLSQRTSYATVVYVEN